MLGRIQNAAATDPARLVKLLIWVNAAEFKLAHMVSAPDEALKRAVFGRADVEQPPHGRP
jgi:hypothetical protein